MMEAFASQGSKKSTVPVKRINSLVMSAARKECRLFKSAPVPVRNNLISGLT